MTLPKPYPPTEIAYTDWNTLVDAVQPLVSYPESEASYIIFTDGVNYYAKNGTTGVIDYTGASSAAVIVLILGDYPTFTGEIYDKTTGQIYGYVSGVRKRYEPLQEYISYPASYVIWTDNTNVYAKDGQTGEITSYADFDNAVNGVTALIEDGVIFVKQGNYTQNAQINAKSHVWIIGECIADQAQLVGVCVRTTGAIRAFNIVSQHYVVVKNIKWESDGSSADYGIYFEDSSYCTFERIFVFHYNYCLYYVAGTYFMNTWRECNFKDGRTWSIYGPPSIQSVFVDTQITSAWFTGGQSLALKNCWVEGNYPNGTYGCRIHQMNCFEVTGGYFENQAGGTGVVLLDIGDASKGGVIEGNSFDCNNKTTNVGIDLGTAGAVLSGIFVGANYFTTVPIPIRIGANIGNTHIENSHGYITINSGTAAILNANTSIVVAHGCSYTPTAKDIVITPTATCTNDPGMIWVDTIGAANFTVNCMRDPGVSTLAFSWAVRRV